MKSPCLELGVPMLYITNQKKTAEDHEKKNAEINDD